MKRRILSIFLIFALIAGSLLAVSCGTLKSERPQAGQSQEETSPQSQQEAAPLQNQEQQSPSQQDEKQPSGGGQTSPSSGQNNQDAQYEQLDENGSYTSKEDVALYLWTYKKLPSNFITKKQAQSLGWSGGSLEKYAKGKCIGGDSFGNREGLLPKGYTYKECDIDTLGAKERGAKRIVYSQDCSLIYYTEDHYSSFELLYGGK